MLGIGDFLRKAGYVCVSVIQVEIVTRTYDVRVGEQLLDVMTTLHNPSIWGAKQRAFEQTQKLIRESSLYVKQEESKVKWLQLHNS